MAKYTIEEIEYFLENIDSLGDAVYYLRSKLDEAKKALKKKAKKQAKKLKKVIETPLVVKPGEVLTSRYGSRGRVGNIVPILSDEINKTEDGNQST